MALVSSIAVGGGVLSAVGGMFCLHLRGFPPGPPASTTHDRCERHSASHVPTLGRIIPIHIQRWLNCDIWPPVVALVASAKKTAAIEPVCNVPPHFVTPSQQINVSPFALQSRASRPRTRVRTGKDTFLEAGYQAISVTRHRGRNRERASLRLPGATLSASSSQSCCFQALTISRRGADLPRGQGDWSRC